MPSRRNQREAVSQFEGCGSSEASETLPTQCSQLRKNGYVMIKSRPCKIVEMSTSRTGKHGHAKVRFIALDIFTGKKVEDICPSTHNMQVPVVTRKDYQLIGISDQGYCGLMDDAGDIKRDIKMADEDMVEQVSEKFANGELISVTVLSAIGEEKIVATKVITD